MEDPSQGQLHVWVDHPWPDGEEPLTGSHAFYSVPPGVGPVEIVSVSGHQLRLTRATDPAYRVILLFDVDSRTFSQPYEFRGFDPPVDN